LEFGEVVRRRRMVRSAGLEPVGEEQVRRILRTARRAPSAGFSQGQSFVVVTDPALRARIAELAGEPAYLLRGYPAWLSAAPVHVVCCTSQAPYDERYAEPDKRTGGGGAWPVPYRYVDAGCALMLLLLAAVDEGLAAGFLGVHRVPGLGDLLGIPPSVEPIGVVTIAHPAPGRPSPSPRRGRRPESEVIHFERWGAGGGRHSGLRGRVTTKTEPSPTTLSTATDPPIAPSSRRQM
jgi:nitroreductase